MALYRIGRGGIWVLAPVEHVPGVRVGVERWLLVGLSHERNDILTRELSPRSVGRTEKWEYVVTDEL